MAMGKTSSKQRIPYGAGEFEIALARGELVARIEPPCFAPHESAEAVVRRSLANPIGSERLRDMASGKRSAAILIPGKDRVAATDVSLPILLDELNEAGIPDQEVEVFIATGTHAKHSVADVAALLGKEAASRVRCREHTCSDDGEIRHVGTTKYGTEVYLHRGVLDAGIKVLTGRIIPHYFAGFSGGRKILIPGVAGFKTICQNHRLTLARGRGIHPQARPCSLEGNPVHLDMLEGAHLVQDVFVLNTLLDTNHNLIGAFAGALEAAHEAGCAEAERLFKVEVEGPLDAAITSAGGAPYDCNFMQALKAVFDIQEIVRTGGAILWVAQCPDGMKKGFLRWGTVESDDELEETVRSDYDLTGHNSIMLRRLIRRVRVALWSGLPDKDVRTVGLEPVHSLQEGLDWLQRNLPSSFRYGVVPHANVTYATLR